MDLPDPKKLAEKTASRHEAIQEKEIEEGVNTLAQLMEDKADNGENAISMEELSSICSVLTFVCPNDLINYAGRSGFNVKRSGHHNVISWGEE